MLSEERTIYGHLRLSDFFNRPGVIEEGHNMDHLTRGLATQPQENVDTYFTSEVNMRDYCAECPFNTLQLI